MHIYIYILLNKHNCEIRTHDLQDKPHIHYQLIKLFYYYMQILITKICATIRKMTI